jgi:hypothetical protein
MEIEPKCPAKSNRRHRRQLCYGRKICKPQPDPISSMTLFGN